MKDNYSVGFYCRTEQHEGIFDLSSDPHYSYVCSLRLDRVFHREHGHYSSELQERNASYRLVNETFPFRFLRELAAILGNHRLVSGVWGPNKRKNIYTLILIGILQGIDIRAMEFHLVTRIVKW